jgi:L-ascorbate metabolism protein UlaG (beta-lactamase superfamily)
VPFEIQYLGWSSFRFVSGNGTNIVTDPCFEGHAPTGIPPAVVTVKDLTDTHAVIVTHAGFDHSAQVLELMEASGGTLFCPRDVSIRAFNKGISSERVFSMVQGMRFQIRDIHVKALEVIHPSMSESEGHWLTGFALGFIVDFGSDGKIFFGGDSALGMHYRLYGEVYQPDLAVLGIGGGNIRGQFLTVLDPSEAAVATKWLNVKAVIPMHYLGNEAQDFQQRLADHAPGVQLAIMKPGERLRFSSKQGLIR